MSWPILRARSTGSPARNLRVRSRDMAAIWEGGLPIDVLPSEGFLEIKLGADAFAWPVG